MSFSKNLDLLAKVFLAALGFAAIVSPAFAQATRPEDVPDLTQPIEEANEIPVMEYIDWNPEFPVFDQESGLSNGKTTYFTISAYGRDPEGDILKYVFETKNRSWGPTFSNTVPVTMIDAPGFVEITVSAIDSKGGVSEPMTRIIPVLDPVDEELNNTLKDVVDFLNSEQRGDLRALKTINITIEDVDQNPAEAETAQSILAGATPWMDAGVQRCVRQYLDRIAYPVENRLEPGRFTHIDDWGRLLAPNLQATGPVDGFWDNATHFVWSQYRSERATRRYGVSLRDYVSNCLAGRVGTATASAASDAGAAATPGTRSRTDPAIDANAGFVTGLVVGEEAHQAFAALARDDMLSFTDLETIPTGLHTSLRLGNTTITLATTEFRYPPPAKPAPAGTPVAILPFDFVSAPANHRVMGVAAGKVPDGQSRYAFVLSEPASHVGLIRNWNTFALTRFYNTTGTLLAEHRNTANSEFIGFVADRPENRVLRIEFDGVPEHPNNPGNMLYQVGEVDDLYIGTISGPAAPGQITATSSDIIGIWQFADGSQIRITASGDSFAGTICKMSDRLRPYGFSLGELTYRGLKQTKPGIYVGEAKLRSDRGNQWWETITFEVGNDRLTNRFGTFIRVK